MTEDVNVIELRLKAPEQMFNALDASPFQERDLDDKAERFIVGWAQEAGRTAKLQLVILLPETSLRDPATRHMGEAVRNYFGYRARQTRQDLRELLRIGWRSLAIGLAIMIICFVAIHSLDLVFNRSAFTALAEQSLLILGWVANWRPLEIFLYDWWPILRRYRLLRRLEAMPVDIRAPEPQPQTLGDPPDD